MAYELTKKKLNAERKAFMVRLWEVLSASALSTYAGLVTFFLVGVVVGHS